MDKRLQAINDILSEYAVGKFDRKLKISPRRDETDAIINGINMMGEELRSITISRDYFNNIFDSVNDMVFIVNTNGIIVDANQPATTQLKYEPGSLQGKSLQDLLKSSIDDFRYVLKELKTKQSIISKEGIIYTSKGVRIPVQLNVSFFKRSRSEKQLVIVSASDITSQKHTENLVVRAMIDAQEKERRRLAKDLHDSLTQQLSGIKFHISSTIALMQDPEQQTILQQANTALMAAIKDMRNLCFSLMPTMLEEFGLVKAVREFCKQFGYREQARFLIQQNSRLPELSPAVEIDLYRIIQEFISNALLHGKASKIAISFHSYQQLIRVRLKDNGKGFRINQPRKGMGIQNMQSRINSHKGTLNLKSELGKGSVFTITIPLINNYGIS
ncbi:PAS domain S-box protein [Ginsengibacter hankyongi]|uniref:Oxygen sensor histidine kinase NreB n=1 Tax=Ginsengibacter hankyongi TaxID=2607284 RepID=A0A5J5IFE4_9BACT|nr:PAS domain S-box protein [Ginsengibacter hankyongi]KAA9038748.1 PAS domain S-box protein [Ginsengibacter hankyongi]